MLKLFRVILWFLVFNLVKTLKICRESSIEENVVKSDVIISGIVRKLERDYSKQTYGAYIQIHRVIKGNAFISDNFNVSFEKIDYKTKRTHRASLPSGLLNVRNFGSEKICDSNVKPNDIRIFLLRFDQKQKNLLLNSSVIKITLSKMQNFELIDNNYDLNATKYTDCTSNLLKICHYGATCQINLLTNQAKCDCDINCDTFDPLPICGNDGITYKSLCHLKQTKCLLQKPIKIIDHDSCDRLELKLCKNKACPNYATCKIEENGLVPKCVCPTSCQNHTSEFNSDSNPRHFSNEILLNRIICGSDGNDYENFCELKKFSCKMNREIKIAYFGKCNPCDDIECSYPKQCKLNSNREPYCTCDYDCIGTTFKPVCGSNGKTYYNECYMNLESCRLNVPIRVYQNFDCSYVRNPCDELLCEQYHGNSYCEIDQQGKAYCKCQDKCEKVLDYVCGSDRITYENECALRRESCFSNQLITVLHVGICGTMNPCVDHRCNFGGHCEIINNVPICKCLECTEVYKPVCGSDGVTYNNMCKMRYESCKKQVFIELAYEGVCDRCKLVSCPFYGTCVDDGFGTNCVCQDICADINMPTCGSNGVTYDSVCHLQLESCKTKKIITVLHNGKCDLCANLKCESLPVDPVCGSDGITHANDCYLKLTACITKNGITIAYKGPCNHEHDLTIYKNSIEKCEDCGFNSDCYYSKENNSYQCLCNNFDCENVKRNLICGSNGVLYENKCQLEKDQCKKQNKIAERPLTECSLPCNGFTPLINPNTNKEYSCEVKRDCPYNSFCDKNHSKCCPKKTSYSIDRILICEKDTDCGEQMLCIYKKCVSNINCSETEHGCCDDGTTIAKGPFKEGCPKPCNCHPAGSYNQFCDPITGNCPCRPGVLGKYCDSCSIGYWGIKKILDSNNIGCLPCACNKLGSLREDCNQENGQCQCKNGVTGLKCNECASNKELTVDGCVSLTDHKEQIENLCSKLICNYPGSYCSIENGIPRCICDSINCESDSKQVCGQDGQTYSSKCDLIKFSCAKQIEIEVAYFGQCNQGILIPRNFTTSYYGFSFKDEPKPYGTTQCKKDYECGKNMECLENICYCIDGFVPENDHCIMSKKLATKSSNFGHNQKRFTFNPCKSKPCFPGSYCENLSNAKFICHCPLGRHGFLCEKNNTSFMFPSFKFHSFLELSPMIINFNDFSLDIEFKSNHKDGSLINFYSSSNENHEFLSIYFKNEEVVLRIYENSFGFKDYRTLNRIILGKFHKIFIKKKNNFLFVQIDDQFPYREQTSFKYFLNEKRIFLGEFGIRNSLKINKTQAFQGCIQFLKIKNKIFNITFPSVDIKNGANIEECPDNDCLETKCQNNGRCRLKNNFNNKITAECICKDGFKDKTCEKKINPCSSSPCRNYNQSQCIPTSSGTYQCVCSENFDGDNCENFVYLKKPFTASFEGKSYIEKPPLDFDITLIEIVFYSKKPNGILFYYRGLRPDVFIGAKLENSYFFLVISLNDKFESIISRSPIEAFRWNKVRIIKENYKFKFFFNYDKYVISAHDYPTNSFNSNYSYFIGGVKDSNLINKKFKITKGLNGAIQKANFNGNYQTDIRLNAIELGGVYSYTGFPCNVTCLNNGICIPNLNKFKCKCPRGFRGKYCQRVKGRKIRNYVDKSKKSLPEAIFLDGHTELIYKNRIYDVMKVQNVNKFELSFKTKNNNGLLLFTGNGNSISFLYIAIQNGKLVFSFSLPKHKQSFSLSSKTKLNDNNWHLVLIERNRRKAILNIDNNVKLNATFDEINYVGYGNLATDGYVRLGGYRKLPIGMPQNLNIGFQGCIKNFKMDDRPIDLIENNLNSKFNPNLCSTQIFSSPKNNLNKTLNV
ncbi:unnamed protein product [Brachionus calyciflorus]|uniref:Agrin n=1 Tax=Brachionus calyciflorus TaxID=104777 RepID=A0A813MF56_9BILA|nr:unnamed protein product [Brachionus calyciflorus]